MKKVLLIDDDLAFLSALESRLGVRYQVHATADCIEGIRWAVQYQPDVIILDLNMRQMRGTELCKELQSKTTTRLIPVIMLTGVTDLESCLGGLSSGADDYLRKPCSTAELIARIDAKIRRRDRERKSSETIVLKNLRINPETQETWVNEKAVSLTRAQYELLRYFVENPNKVISRNQLLSDLWPDSVVAARTIDKHVSLLRKKLSQFSLSIDTMSRSGYILRTI